MTSDTATDTETQTADEVVEEVVEDAGQEEQQPEEDNQQQDQEKQEESVPVSAHVAERKKRQEAEERARMLEQQMSQYQQPAKQEPDNSNDLLTVGQQKQTLEEWKRSILEEAYMEQNPKTIERITNELPGILKDPKRQWLADSIAQAPNRLQRAAEVLEMFEPGKKEQKPAPDRSKTPKSPQSVAKTNKMSTADRIMSMSDEELEQWRLSQKVKK